MSRGRSLTAKMIMLFTVTLSVVVALSTIMARQTERTLRERADTQIQRGAEIGLNAVIQQRRATLRKLVMGLLQLDELMGALAETEGQAAQAVVRGMFLSLEERHVARLTVYRANARVLIDEHVTGHPANAEPPSPSVKGAFKAAAKDLEVHFYFRTFAGGPAQYCAAAAVTDDDDALLGYVELALLTQPWGEQMAALLQREVGITGTDGVTFGWSTQPDLFAELKSAAGAQMTTWGAGVVPVGAQSHHAVALPLAGADGRPVGWLWLTADCTEALSMADAHTLKTRGLLALVLLIAVALVFIALRVSVTGPILKTVKFAEAVAEGQVDLVLEVPRNGEVGALAAALERMVENLKVRAQLAGRIATGDLTEHGHVYSDRDVLGVALRQMTENLTARVNKIREASLLVRELSGQSSQFCALSVERSESVTTQTDQITASSRQISARITDTAGTAAEVSSTLDRVAEVSDEIVSGVDAVVEAAGEIAQALVVIAAHAREGEQISETLRGHAEHTAQLMENLTASVHEIDATTVVIRQIANRTRLLSLNAQIEAASAGEAGRGFAVVATEVKALADQSEHASGGIAERVAAVRASTAEVLAGIEAVLQSAEHAHSASNAIVGVVDEQTERSGALASDAAEMNTRLKDISADLGGVARAVSSLSTGMEDASAQVHDVTVRIEQVDEAMQQAHSGAQSMCRASGGLLETAGELGELVEQFQLKQS